MPTTTITILTLFIIMLPLNAQKGTSLIHRRRVCRPLNLRRREYSIYLKFVEAEILTKYKNSRTTKSVLNQITSCRCAKYLNINRQSLPRNTINMVKLMLMTRGLLSDELIILNPKLSRKLQFVVRVWSILAYYFRFFFFNILYFLTFHTVVQFIGKF